MLCGRQSVIAKYRLLLMSGREVRLCRTFCPAWFNTHKMFDKENKNGYWYLPVINWGKCLTGAQNVRQGTEGLPDILSGIPEIIFAITVDNACIKTFGICGLRPARYTYRFVKDGIISAFTGVFFPSSDLLMRNSLTSSDTLKNPTFGISSDTESKKK